MGRDVTGVARSKKIKWIETIWASQFISSTDFGLHAVWWPCPEPLGSYIVVLVKRDSSEHGTGVTVGEFEGFDEYAFGCLGCASESEGILRSMQVLFGCSMPPSGGGELTGTFRH